MLDREKALYLKALGIGDGVVPPGLDAFVTEASLLYAKFGRLRIPDDHYPLLYLMWQAQSAKQGAVPLAAVPKESAPKELPPLKAAQPVAKAAPAAKGRQAVAV